MIRRISLGDVALVAAIVVLALAAANELEAFADAHQQKAGDRAAFAHYVRGWTGRFARVGVSIRPHWDLACALNRTLRRSLICVQLDRSSSGVRVVRAYATPVGHGRRHYRCVARDRCPPYLPGRPPGHTP